MSNGMDFAKAQLYKYGWKEGQGIGKHETGITTAVKATLKFDNTGIGHDAAETFTHHWWEDAFNAAADNISVTKAKDGTVTLNTEDIFEISARKVPAAKRKNMLYNNFVMTAMLTNEGSLVDIEKDSSEVTSTETIVATTPNLTDEELFKICGGRTAHKGARHGLGLSGKLARIEEQERQLLKLAEASKHENIYSSKKKSKKTRPTVSEITQNIEESESLDIVIPECLKRKKKKKHAVEVDGTNVNTVDNNAQEIDGENTVILGVVVPEREKSEKLNKRKKHHVKGDDILSVDTVDNIAQEIDGENTVILGIDLSEREKSEKRNKRKKHHVKGDNILSVDTVDNIAQEIDGENTVILGIDLSEREKSEKRNKRKKHHVKRDDIPSEDTNITQEIDRENTVILGIDVPEREKSEKQNKKKKHHAKGDDVSTVDTVDSVAEEIVEENTYRKKNEKRKRKRELSE